MCTRADELKIFCYLVLKKPNAKFLFASMESHTNFKHNFSYTLYRAPVAAFRKPPMIQKIIPEAESISEAE